MQRTSERARRRRDRNGEKMWQKGQRWDSQKERHTFRQTERARTASCSAVIGLRQTPREEQISPVTFRALLPPTASWDHSKRATALPVNLRLPVTLSQLAHARSLFLPIICRAACVPSSGQTVDPYHPFCPHSSLAHCHPPEKAGGESERANVGMDRKVKGQRKWGIQGKRSKGRRYSHPLSVRTTEREKESKKKERTEIQRALQCTLLLLAGSPRSVLRCALYCASFQKCSVWVAGRHRSAPR